MKQADSSPMRMYSQARRFLFILLIITPIFLIMPRIYHNPGIGKVIIAYTPFYLVSRAAAAVDGNYLWITAGLTELAILVIGYRESRKQPVWMSVIMAIYVLDTVLFAVYLVRTVLSGEQGAFMTAAIAVLIRALYFYLIYGFGWKNRRPGTMTDEELIAAGIPPEVPIGLNNRRGDKGGYARFDKDEVILILDEGASKGSFEFFRVKYPEIVRLAFDPEDNDWLWIRIRGDDTDPQLKLSREENRTRFLKQMSLHGIEHPSFKN